MSKEKHRLDEFFRNRLGSVEKESWNTPSNLVFENAMAQLDKNRRRGFFWLFRGLLILIIVGFAVWSFTTIGSLENKLASVKVTETPSKAMQIEEKKKPAEQTILADQIIVDQVEDKPVLKYSSPSFKNTLPDLAELRNPISHQSMEYGFKSEQVHKPNAQTDFISEEIEVEPEIFEEVESSTEAQRPDTLPSETKSEDIAAEGEQNRSRQLYVFGGLNWSSLNMTAAEPLPDNLKEYDNWYLGWQYGIGIQKSIKGRWSYDLGFSFTHLENRSKFVDVSEYDEINESVNSNGELRYNTSLGFESPFNPFSGAVSFNPDGQDLKQGDPMQVELAINNRFQVWGTSFGVSYSIIQHGRISAGIHTRVGLNYISELGQNLEFELKKDNRILDRSSTISYANNYSKIFTSYSVGAHADYRLSQWNFGVQVQYGGSLNSIRKVDPSSLVKTNLTTISTNVRIGWSF